MDVDELYLDLLALRELYILLLKTCLRDANSELLDERAQMVLKHLLDDATAGVLEFHSKNLATDCNFYSFLHKDDKQAKPPDEKVVEWMEDNQNARNMGNSEIEYNPKRARASASNVAMSYLSNDISSALRRIELHILSLQRCTSQSRNTRSPISETKLGYCGKSVLQGNETLNQQKVTRTDHSTLRTRFTESIKGHNMSSQLRSHLVGGQKVKPIVTNHCSEFVHGFRIPLSQDNDEAMKPPTVETRISKQHKLVNPTTLIDKSGCSVGSKATARSSMKLDQARRQEKRSHNAYGHMIMRPTLLDHPSREVRKEQSHNKSHLATQEESEFTNAESESESASSSSWETQQTSESETTDDPSSPSHQDGPPATDSEASSRYRSSSSSSSISTKAFKLRHGKKESKLTIGRLQRLKKKLGLIFHHHHHHHHNSHNIMWKQIRKIFHRKHNRKLTSKEERFEGKVKKTAMRSVSRKNQVGKFQALAEGLRSHVWRSKATKKKEVRGLNCGKKKKGGKKLHWWKMFHGRHGVKLPRVKIGYVNRKP